MESELFVYSLSQMVDAFRTEVEFAIVAIRPLYVVFNLSMSMHSAPLYRQLDLLAGEGNNIDVYENDQITDDPFH